ncbi:hypothetical protein QP157_06820 [Sphingomonas sp. LR61]|uniref:hypothetical protein n=1 Tax=Sphingomonas sp. LR61 TaxID=3050234 RepID=UPI002FE2E130
MNADDVIFSVLGFGVSWSFLLAAVSAVGAAAAAWYARRTARTDEKARKASDEPLFRGRWLMVRRDVGALDEETGEYETQDYGPFFRVENIGRVVSRSTECSAPGILLPGRDLQPGWHEDFDGVAMAGVEIFTLSWIGGGGTRESQKLRPGTAPSQPQIWDPYGGDFINA